MTADDPAAAGAGAAARPREADSPGAAAPTLFGIAAQLIDDLRGALQARAHLFVLEAQRAGLALSMMALYAVIAGLLLVTAWFFFWILLIAVAVNLGAPLWLALVVVLGVSLLVAWLLLRLVRSEARHLLFPASVRQLGPAALDESPRAVPRQAAGAAE